jgi:hypothetical protein
VIDLNELSRASAEAAERYAVEAMFAYGLDGLPPECLGLRAADAPKTVVVHRGPALERLWPHLRAAAVLYVTALDGRFAVAMSARGVRGRAAARHEPAPPVDLLYVHAPSNAPLCDLVFMADADGMKTIDAVGFPNHGELPPLPAECQTLAQARSLFWALEARAVPRHVWGRYAYDARWVWP